MNGWWEKERERFHDEISKHRKGGRWRDMFKRDYEVINQQIHPSKANNKIPVVQCNTFSRSLHMELTFFTQHFIMQSMRRTREICLWHKHKKDKCTQLISFLKI